MYKYTNLNIYVIEFELRSFKSRILIFIFSVESSTMDAYCMERCPVTRAVCSWRFVYCRVHILNYERLSPANMGQ